MRITIDVDEDVLDALRELAQQRDVTVEQVASDLVREALRPSTEYKMRNGLPLLPVRPDAVPVTLDLVRRLEWDD